MNAKQTLVAAALAAALLPAAEGAAGERGVHARQSNQHQRIAQGVRHGELDRLEAQRLHDEQRRIREQASFARTDGAVTPSERRQLHASLNSADRHIYNERHDAQRGWQHAPVAGNDAHGGWHDARGGWHDARSGWHDARSAWHDARSAWPHGAPHRQQAQSRNIDMRQREERERIARGIHSGQLTPDEARTLIAEQRAIAADERRFRADGVLSAAERATLIRELDAAGRHIRIETHDAEVRRRLAY